MSQRPYYLIKVQGPPVHIPRRSHNYRKDCVSAHVKIYKSEPRLKICRETVSHPLYEESLVKTPFNESLNPGSRLYTGSVEEEVRSPKI